MARRMPVGLLVCAAALIAGACTPVTATQSDQASLETAVSGTLTVVAASPRAAPTPYPTPAPTLPTVGPCAVRPGSPTPPDLSDPTSIVPNLLGFLNAGGFAASLPSLLEAARLTPPGSLGPAEMDFTGDGRFDIALSLLQPGSEGVLAPGAVYLFVCSGDAYTLAYTSPAVAHAGAPLIHAAQDLTGDSIGDLLIGFPICGAHTCQEQVQALTWNGLTLENRLAGTTDDLPTPTFQVMGPTASGAMDIAITATGIASVGAGPFRPITRTWSWDPPTRTFIVSGEVQQPANYRIHVLLDADRAAREGNYATALDLYYRVVTDDTLDDWAYGETGKANLSAYAAFRHMVTHVQQGDLGDAQVVYGILQGSYPLGATGHAYAELATAFWDEFQRSGGLAAACARAQSFAAAHTSEILDPLQYGYANPTYLAADICPTGP